MEVALRKESVDRNRVFWSGAIVSTSVALRKESVDRNFGMERKMQAAVKSLSARRAWIEIPVAVLL